jgi:hypothetical protein
MVSEPSAPWHQVLGPLPPGLIPRAAPALSRDEPAPPDQAALAGWQTLTLEISGSDGLRIVLVLVDDSGTALSASDHVAYRRAVGPRGEGDPAGNASMYQLEQISIGGRFEPDGSFRGTWWHAVGAEPIAGEEPTLEFTPRTPTPEEIAGLRTIVREVQRRYNDQAKGR